MIRIEDPHRRSKGESKEVIKAPLSYDAPHHGRSPGNRLSVPSVVDDQCCSVGAAHPTMRIRRRNQERHFKVGSTRPVASPIAGSESYLVGIWDHNKGEGRKVTIGYVV